MGQDCEEGQDQGRRAELKAMAWQARLNVIQQQTIGPELTLEQNFGLDISLEQTLGFDLAQERLLELDFTQKQTLY